MNKERMLKLADALERSRLGVRFNMRSLCSDGDAVVGDQLECGTSCCIAGMACLMFGGRGCAFSGTVARSLLDLNSDQANRLFYNSRLYVSPKEEWRDITKKEAVAAIRRMVREEGDA